METSLENTEGSNDNNQEKLPLSSDMEVEGNGRQEENINHDEEGKKDQRMEESGDTVKKDEDHKKRKKRKRKRFKIVMRIKMK